MTSVLLLVAVQVEGWEVYFDFTRSCFAICHGGLPTVEYIVPPHMRRIL